MPESMKELVGELAGLERLVARVRALDALEPADRELLEDLVQEHAGRTQARWTAARVSQAVDLLFPSYDGRAPAVEKPVRWPGKAWWWNGASIEDSTELHNGDIEVELKSYVGGGDYDDYRFTLPKAWLDADDMTAVITQACLEERARLAAETRADELAKAQREAHAANARLAQLQSHNA